MADVDVEQWLEGWVENNLGGASVAQPATDVNRQAEVCIAEAAVAGISSDELTMAAGGNLATYLADRQVAMTTST